MAAIQNLLSDAELWFDTVPSDFVFLLVLPFVVAAAGLWSDSFRNRSKQR